MGVAARIVCLRGVDDFEFLTYQSSGYFEAGNLRDERVGGFGSIRLNEEGMIIMKCLCEQKVLHTQDQKVLAEQKVKIVFVQECLLMEDGKLNFYCHHQQTLLYKNDLYLLFRQYLLILGMQNLLLTQTLHYYHPLFIQPDGAKTTHPLVP
jgi:hypothetical protein